MDRNGVVLADNKTVCTVSVIHNQITEPEKVIAMLVKELGISETEARKRVENILPWNASKAMWTRASVTESGNMIWRG